MARLTVPSVQEEVIGVPTEGKAPGADAFGGIAARQAGAGAEAGMKTGMVFTEIALDMRDKQDVQDATDASNKLKAYSQERARAVSELSGEAAAGASVREAEAFNKTRTEASDKLNPRARVLYHNQAQPTAAGLADHVAKHEFQQRRETFVKTSTTSLNLDLSASLSNVDNLSQHAVTRVNIDKQAKSMGKELGWTPEMTEAFVLERTTMMHEGIIKNLNDTGRTSEATAWFKAHKKEVMGQKHDEINKVLKEGYYSEKEQEFGDMWQKGLDQATSMDGPAGLLQLEKDIGRTIREEIKDPLLRKRVEQDMRQRVNDQRNRITQTQAAAYDAGLQQAIATGSRPPASVWTSMRGDQQATIENYLHARGQRSRAESLAAARGEEFAPVNDANTFDSIHAQMRDQREKWLSRNLALDRPFLSRQTYEHLVSLQTHDNLHPQNAAVTQSAQSMVHGKVLEIMPKIKGGENEERVAERQAVNNEMMGRVSAAQAEKQKKSPGAKLTDAETTKIVEDYVVSGTTKGGWFSSRSDPTKGVLLKTEEEINHFEPTPMWIKGQMQKNENLKDRNGKAIPAATEEEIKLTYVNWLRVRSGLPKLNLQDWYKAKGTTAPVNKPKPAPSEPVSYASPEENNAGA